MTSKTLASIMLALILTASLVTSADARTKKKYKYKKQNESVAILLLKKQAADMIAMRRELSDIRKLLRPQSVIPLPAQKLVSIDPEPPKIEPPRNPVAAVEPMPVPDPDKTLRGYEAHIAKSAKLKDLTPKLADKVAEILVACPSSRLSSAYRKNARVRGSGRPSLHSHYPSRAADMAGDPTCIRRHLVGWPGGLSTDYKRVRHYHFSYAPGGREWGARFAHYGSRKARKQRRYG